MERFIDGYRTRNERLADLMRRFQICEERSRGVDRLVGSVEVEQLPPPDFRSDLERTSVTIFGARPFERMDRWDRIRAAYQHSALRWVIGEYMTNASLRERLGLAEGKSVTTFQVIKASIGAKLVKPDERTGSSRKLARYLPYWA